MKMTKKVLGVLLALAMLVNVFAIFSSALAPDSAVDLYIRTDKTEYKPGDTVYVTVSEQVIAEVGQMRIGGGYVLGYNSNAIEINKPASKDYPSINVGLVAHQAGYDDSISVFNWTEDLLFMGDTIDEGNNWDSLVNLILCDDGLTAFDAFEKTDLFTFEMYIPEDAVAGEYILGFNRASYVNYSGYANDNAMGGVYGEDDKYYGTTDNYGFNNCTFTVVTDEPAGSVVTEKGPQIRYTKTDDGAFANVYDVRTRATIAAADVEATFGTKDAAALETAITSVGFVYAPAGTAFDTAAAQAAAKAGTSQGGYTVAPVNYIQQDADGNLMFTCLVTGINTNAAGEGLQTYAYICVNGEYYFYDAATTVSYNELFTNNWASAAGAYGWDTSVPSLG